ncbi:MAG: hypothetical protein QGH50_15095 [SAR324 cluster bacterium]|jgi:hypothetical protein|nr:hypothetical protein [SAR324 cluster bacterium]|tara:strand:- start:325 stop:708 length:384 start_codon:yes stop_codon:yes gene_type:complete
MPEKLEKCPNCDEKLTGMFSGSVVEDEVIREINEKIKNKKEELKDSGEDLVEKEAFCSGCIDNVREILEKTAVSIKSNPKCPSCGIVGMDFIKEFPNVGTKRGSGDPWFEIVACIKCGHVYGTLGGQ